MLGIVTIISIIANLILGLFVYLRNPKNATNWLLSTLNLTNIFWSIANYFSLTTSSTQGTLMWIRLVMFFAVPHAAVYLLLASTFPNDKLIFPKRLLYTYFILIVATMAATISPYLFTDVIINEGNIQPTPGYLMPLFVLTAIGSIFMGSILLIYKFYKAKGLLKIQLSYVLIGIILMFMLTLVSNVLLVLLFHISKFVAFGPVYTFIFFCFVTYAIIRHKLFDIGIVIARTVSFSLLILFLTFIYAVVLVFLLSMFIGFHVDNSLLTISGLLVLIMAFTLAPMRRRIEKLTDRIFFKDRYDAGKLLYNLALKMASTIKLDELMHELLQVLLSQMRVGRGALILTKDHTIGQVAHAGFGIDHKFDQKQLLAIFAENKTLVFEDLVEGSLKEFMRIQGFIIVVPLRSGDKNIGLLVLGEKLSGDLYTDSDIQLLETFAKEAVVAIENARAYEEIQRFNVTLREEVDKATKELKELAQQQKDQMDVVGHEARTPLTTISQELNLILNMILPEQKRKDWQKGDVKPEDTKRVIEGLTSMNIAAKQESSIINNMVEAARIDKQTFELNYSNFDLIALIQLAIKESQGRLASNKKQGNITFQPKLNVLEVEADKTRIKQCIDGLLTNAEKYGVDPQNKTLNITVAVKVEKGNASISVKDQGIGIEAKDMEKLGKKFSRLNPYAKGSKFARPGGTGLGLYTFKGIMEKHRGQLVIEGEGIGKGSTFTIELPVRKAINNDTQPVNEAPPAVR